MFFFASGRPSRLQDVDGARYSAEARNGGRRFRRCRAVCRIDVLAILEFHRSIALYGIIHSMKEVLQRRCVCRRACARPRRVVHRVHRRYAMQSVRKVTYAYDALGRRVSTTTREGAIRHVYDGVQCIADIDGKGDVVASYIWGAGIDNLLAIHIGGATYYPLTDVQGTIWGYADANNAIVARFEYDAWGNILSATSSVSELVRNRYRFQCREWSAATGLVNFRARWYDAVTGRWLSKDPIGLNGGLNLYAFCGNDPINYCDFEGLECDKKPGMFLPPDTSIAKFH